MRDVDVLVERLRFAGAAPLVRLRVLAVALFFAFEARVLRGRFAGLAARAAPAVLRRGLLLADFARTFLLDRFGLAFFGLAAFAATRFTLERLFTPCGITHLRN